MKHLLNTLFITTQGAYLHKDGETVVVKVENEIRLRVPVHMISGIVCFGNVLCSPFLLGFCAENNVGVSFCTEYGKFLASVRGFTSGNVLLRKEQYRRSDDNDFCTAITRSILTGKFANARAVVSRAVRDHSEKMDEQKMNAVTKYTAHAIAKLNGFKTQEELRGEEGNIAHMYFGVFNDLITSQKDDFIFSERSRRPPLDEVNCLLSFIYTLLMHDVRNALECVGLDSAVGYFHKDRPGRPSLALDIMEEFRPFLADRLTLSLINRSQVKKNGFRKTESGAVLMNDDTRKEVLSAYQKRKQEEIMHPFINETVQVGLLFHVQALLLARFLRGDLDGYPPFIWK